MVQLFLFNGVNISQNEITDLQVTNFLTPRCHFRQRGPVFFVPTLLEKQEHNLDVCPSGCCLAIRNVSFLRGFDCGKAF